MTGSQKQPPEAVHETWGYSLFPRRVLDTVPDAMTDHEKLALEVLDNKTKSRALVILKLLKTAVGLEQGSSAG